MSSYLPLLLVLLCPVMMLLMMRGHGHGSEDAAHSVFDENGRLRRDQNLTLLDRERRRLEEQVAELDAEIAARDPYSARAEARGGPARTAV
jgi:hypothetical protein